MISVSAKTWVEKKINYRLVEKIKQDYNYNDIIAKLIVLRKYDDIEINNISNNLSFNNIFSKDKDFNKATNILLNSINKNDNICILGDYDVDGAASTALLAKYFDYINQKYFYYIPDREIDGYGASTKLFKKLIIQKPKLVIMVDCGSTSINAIEFLNQNNIKSIIIDHHEINKPYPNSNIIINPKKNINNNIKDYVCATTLTYFFIDNLIKKRKSKFNLSEFLIYVLLATVCDVMPLRKFNKILASKTLNNFNLNDNLVFKTIFNQLNIKRKFTIDDLGYLIGPIINAGGRLGSPSLGTKLLISNNDYEINDISSKLIKLNNKRKKLEKKFLNEIDFRKIKKENKNIIIYQNDNLNEGLIGIIAARLKDYFNKPSIVITKSNSILKASARSTTNYNIGHTIKLLIDKKIIENGGGHNMAAGFTIKKDNLKLFNDFIEEDFSKKNINFKPSFFYDSEISATAINLNTYNSIDKLAPFGNGNSSPIFLIKNLKIIKSSVIGDNHIRAIIKSNIGKSLISVCFNCVDIELGNYLLSYKKKINIIAMISKNSINNKNSIQLNIKDLIIPANSA